MNPNEMQIDRKMLETLMTKDLALVERRRKMLNSRLAQLRVIIRHTSPKVSPAPVVKLHQDPVLDNAIRSLLRTVEEETDIQLTVCVEQYRVAQERLRRLKSNVVIPDLGFPTPPKVS